MVAADEAHNEHHHNDDSDRSKNDDVTANNKTATFITNRNVRSFLPHDEMTMCGANVTLPQNTLCFISVLLLHMHVSRGRVLASCVQWYSNSESAVVPWNRNCTDTACTSQRATGFTELGV